MKRAVIFLALSITVLLAGCGEAVEPSVSASIPGYSEAHTPTPAVTATLLPPFVATAQNAQAGAQATIAAAEAAQAQAQLDQAYLMVTQTAISLAQTSAAATEQYFTRQTEQAQAGTATAVKAADDATATAARQTADASATAFSAAQTAQSATSTATAQFAIDVIHAQETSAILGITQAAATAEIERIREQRRAEQQTLLWRTWAWRLLGAAAFVLIFALAVILVWKSWPVILTRLGVVRWGKDGKPYIVVPRRDGSIVAIDMTRSLGAGIVLTQDNRVLTQGVGGDPALQSQVTARSQAAELVLAANTTSGDAHPGTRRAAVRQAIRTLSPEQPQGYRVLGSGESLPGSLTPGPAVLDQLDAQWRELDDDD